MDPELEFQLRHLAMPGSMAREHSNMFVRNVLWLVVTLPPMVATLSYAGLRLLRWANEEPEKTGSRWLWFGLWASGFAVLAIGIFAAKGALRAWLKP